MSEALKVPDLKFRDYGLAVEHNMRCPVCCVDDAKAVYQMNDGVFLPCWKCQARGWRTVQVKGWKRWLMRALKISRR